MRPRDLILDTLHTLKAHKLRTALTMFGIAWGIVSIVLMVAAGEGLRVGERKMSEGFGKDLMIVFAGRTSLQAGGLRAGRRLRWQMDDVPGIADNAPDCRYVLPELGQNDIRIRSPYNDAAITVTGSDPAFADIRSIDVEEGRFYNEEDVRAGRRVAFLGSEARQQLFGTRPAIGETIFLNSIPYRVIGLMHNKKQDSSYDGWDVRKVFVPISAMIRDFPNRPPDPPGTLDRLLVAPHSIEQHAACKAQIRLVLGRIYRFDPRDEEAASIWDTIENAKAFRRMTEGMKYFLGAVGIVTLFLGGIGVMNVMLVAVRERTREIGIRKAVGATQSAIIRQFFFESAMVALTSGAVGLAIAYGLCTLVNLLPMPDYFAGLLPTWYSSLLAVGLLGTVAVSAALYPARKAARVDPVKALHYEAGG
ncbi:MAG TPA: ABC transporter permease [Terriglobales bacterium]|nr:ABC transporter permease [Terriglobales bacterium]